MNYYYLKQGVKCSADKYLGMLATRIPSYICVIFNAASDRIVWTRKFEK